MIYSENERVLRLGFEELTKLKLQFNVEKEDFRVQTLQLKELSLMLEKKSEEAAGVHQEALQHLAISERLKQQCDEIKEHVETEGERLAQEREQIRTNTVQFEQSRLEVAQVHSSPYFLPTLQFHGAWHSHRHATHHAKPSRSPIPPSTCTVCCTALKTKSEDLF